MKKMVLRTILLSGMALAVATSAFAANDQCADLAGNWHAANQGGYQSVDLTIDPGTYGDAQVNFVINPNQKDGGSADYKSCSVVGSVSTEEFYTNIPGLGAVTMEAKLTSPSTIQYKANLGGMYKIPEITMTKK
jgi:hypothetical protein